MSSTASVAGTGRNKKTPWWRITGPQRSRASRETARGDGCRRRGRRRSPKDVSFVSRPDVSAAVPARQTSAAS